MATPDFEHDAGFQSMALSILDAVSLQQLSDDDRRRLHETTVTALKMVWNARGVADLAQLELPVSEIQDAIRALDK